MSWLVMRTGKQAGRLSTPRAWLNRGGQAWESNSSTSSGRTAVIGGAKETKVEERVTQLAEGCENRRD